jgi:release factor glutamine methyltransferase
MPRDDRRSDFMTLRRAERGLARRFAEAGIEGAARDARLLIEAAAGVEARDWLTDADQRLSPETVARIEAFALRRLAREPVSRILGRRGFFGRDFEITPATLDPRPDSETLIELALELLLSERAARAPFSILDIGTGSGCLLVTLLAELPAAIGTGSDIDDAALMVAARNAERHGVAARATWQRARSLSGVEGPFDLIVANPPYIPRDIIATLTPEVRHYDPLPALDGGIDGLDVYREIICGLNKNNLRGWILFEIGHDQAPSVDRLLDQCASLDPSTRRRKRDLGGHIRCVARKAQFSEPAE